MYGATWNGGATEFRVWAPAAERVTLRLLGAGSTRDLPMRKEEGGSFTLAAAARPGDRYYYLLDEQASPVPDPVSRFLPEGVHGPSEIVDPSRFEWTDSNWRGLELRDYVIYELHVGTFTPAGTFDGVRERLDYLKNTLGISVIELMPVAAFPGERNWGYDGVSPYAVQASYGGAEGLRRLVNAAHALDLAVMLDVVYNHLGHEGNYLRRFGPYFTSRHQTPWGDALNYDGPGCENVRRYLIENALYWIREYHLDGLRLDAIQTIHDDSRKHIVAEIQQEVQALAKQLGRKVCVIAETDSNDANLVRPSSAGGFGLDAIWSDDFHHALHTYLTGEHRGYYQDFGQPQQIVRALEQGFVFQGEFFKFWGKTRGTSATEVPLPAHVISIQNHDQVGNRALGERLTALIPRGARKLLAGLLLLAPHTPLLFMGQEYDEPAPFLFFTNYGDPQLQRAVREGRRQEFKDFDWREVPDPEDPVTFARSKLNWSLVRPGNEMLDWYRALIALRRRMVIPGGRTCRAQWLDGSLLLSVPAEAPRLQVMARFPQARALPHPSAEWKLVLASDEDGYSVAVYERG